MKERKKYISRNNKQKAETIDSPEEENGSHTTTLLSKDKEKERK